MTDRACRHGFTRCDECHPRIKTTTIGEPLEVTDKPIVMDWTEPILVVTRGILKSAGTTPRLTQLK